MSRVYTTIISSVFILFFLEGLTVYAQTEPLITISPQVIYQGDPVLLTINSSSVPAKVFFDKKNIPIFKYIGKYRAFIPIDINLPSGGRNVYVSFTDGNISTTSINVIAREKIELPLGIPEKLGGNTPIAATNLISNLAKENATLVNLKTGTKAFWTKPFRAPLSTSTITDPYGYNRRTVNQTITHKGTDFRASENTRVYAMNRGVVRVARTYTVYGKSIIVDHGLGLQTLYMHLSKIYVNVGELVLPGQIIGLSGKTGYAEMPHLHISIKIDGISIDPATFLKFFGAI